MEANAATITWQEIANRYPEGARLSGAVTNLTDYGCF